MHFTAPSWLLATTLLLVGCKPTPCESEAAEQAAAGQAAAAEQTVEIADLDNEAFRNRVVEFVRQVSVSDTKPTCTLPALSAPLHVVVSMYYGGKRIDRATSSQDQLCAALSEATRELVEGAKLNAERIAQARFSVELTHRGYGVIEYEGKGLELVAGQIPVRNFDKSTLRQRIDEGKAYLLRVMDPKLGGVNKYYRAATDSFDERLHTIYTASTIYTLLALQAHKKDESLNKPIMDAAEFLLSMQYLAPGQPAHGAFHYSLDRPTRQPEPRFVVGTTSKTIFTLIKLDARSEDPRYMEAARLAADWLLTMQGPDGSVSAGLQLGKEGELEETERESMLYTGQVLSALSRLYEATKDARYLEGATRTANYMRAKVEAEGCYLGDDYRDPNPISSSWTILSLFDFARASEDAQIRKLVYGCADELLKRQINDPSDIYRYGRWNASLSSSGAGWMAEVLSELYLACPADDPEGCVRYRDAIIRVFRVLMQYTYTPENSFVTKNPEMARGGQFWNSLDRDVRTDSVCHAMNAYVFMIDHMPEGALVELPQPPLPIALEANRSSP